MRIGAVYNPHLPNSQYRCVIPLRALERRGHEVLWPADTVGQDRIDRLLDCDLVHMHRQYGPATLAVVPLLRRSGVAVSWDNDDDLAAVPVESPHHEAFSGTRGAEIEGAWRRIVTRASVVTTTTARLAERLFDGGAARVEVIENALPAHFLRQHPREHEGVVVGWIAGTTHAADAQRLGIDRLLAEMLDDHGQLHVATIGLDLAIDHPRYHHLPRVEFDRLLDAAAGFDIGIAPLADLAFNEARSDVKAREYAALGIPWLASPVGPYRRLGTHQGGELVADGDWRQALERLLDGGERTRRGAVARRWAESVTIDTLAGRWESVFASAIEHPSTDGRGAE
ncbi:MAG: hypothetical protein ACR2NA_10995 [Solirubrobacterales bacterium]